VLCAEEVGRDGGQELFMSLHGQGDCGLPCQSEKNLGDLLRIAWE